MSTAFARAAAAAVQVLQAAAVSANVYRSRARVVPKQMPTAVVVRLVQAEGNAGVGQSALSLWGVQLAVECYARATADAPSDDVLDELLQAATTALMADASLGGVVGFIQPQAIAWDFDVDGEQTACATAHFLVQQAVRPASLH